MLTAVFIVGKLGPIEGNYRYIDVEKVPDNEDFEANRAPIYDRFKVRMWSGSPGILNRLPDGKLVTIKGRIEERNGEVIVVIELLRG